MNRRDTRRLRRIILAALLPLAVALMILPARFTQPGRTVLLTITGPVEMTMSHAFDTVASLPRRFRDATELDRHNRDLVQEVDALRAEVARLEARRQRDLDAIRQLQKLGKVDTLRNDHAFYPAEVIGKRYVRNMTGVVDGTLKLGIGSTQGVRTDDLVVVEHAVVGVLATVSPWVSEVRLVTHPDFRVLAITSETRVECVLIGDGVDRCQFIDPPDRARFKVGDYVLTSGFDERHPPGLLLGTVEQVTRDPRTNRLVVTVKPAFRPDRLHQVVVVRRRDTPD
ncbi:MAG TPA: rod shape-determining protein MreC [Planctomycetota bacterium]|nr:rod shape-determining protein MreC [Planctomycetota bacterium]